MGIHTGVNLELSNMSAYLGVKARNLELHHFLIIRVSCSSDNDGSSLEILIWSTALIYGRKLVSTYGHFCNIQCSLAIIILYVYKCMTYVMMCVLNTMLCIVYDDMYLYME